jgi:GNAT superfamily N-acetyltransferase
MIIRLASTDADITACYPVMHELRGHISSDEFLGRVRVQQDAGYRLALVQEQDAVVAVAGFRLGESLSWGHYLYVEDLVTLSSHRSRGYGTKLLAWLKEYAARAGCRQLHLDSGNQRTAAHRFYEREGMASVALHFAANIANGDAP